MGKGQRGGNGAGRAAGQREGDIVPVGYRGGDGDGRRIGVRGGQDGGAGDGFRGRRGFGI